MTDDAPWWSDDAVAPPGEPRPGIAAASAAPPVGPGDVPPRPARETGLPSGALIALIAGLAGALVGAGSVVAYDHNDNDNKLAVVDPGATITQTVTGSASVQRPVGSVAAIAAKIVPSVVTIEEKSGTTEGTGSGVVLRKDGYILTNNHVVAEVGTTGTLTVIQAGKSEASAIKAVVVGTDPLTDLAVIKAQSGVWIPAQLGKSASLVVGDPLIAVGAPLGLRGTVTTGIVSALNRFVHIDTNTDYDRAIQTDAAINPGNSGGALVDSSGSVIGINSAIATASGDTGQSGNIGVGFAIPIDEAAPIAQDIIRTGKASHAYLGVVTQDSTSPVGAVIASQADPDTGQKTAAVSANSPAARAHLQEGDVIEKVDSTPVDGAEALIAAIRTHRAGDKVLITYSRSMAVRTVNVTLVERPTG